VDCEEPDRRIPGLEQVPLCAARGSSHLVGEPGIGDIEEEFDRWFVKQLERTELGNLLDMPNYELMEAGNGTGQLGALVAVAGSVRGRLFTTLSYEPIYEWINGMGVVIYDDELPSTA
jgi:hypothetical protein